MVGLTRSSQIFYRPPWLKGAVTGIALLLCWLPLASAHTGPPTPILVDHMIGPYPVSVWADPEVGTGTFFIRLEPPSGGAIPGDTTVQIGVQPVNGRLAEARYTARLQEVGGRVQYQAEVPFDAQELWRVRIIVHSSGGSGEATIDVEAIPPGLGQWDILLYLFPFLAVGFLGLQMVLYGRKHSQARRGQYDIGTDQKRKGSDYNTTFAKIVRPYQRRISPNYSAPSEHLEDDPAHRRHSEDWQR